jgi:trk system potassium uptake protein
VRVLGRLARKTVAVVQAAVGHPARGVVAGFAVAIVLGTVLLRLPFAHEVGLGTDVVTALFTATSAVCVTGLVVVDTAGHWSVFGEVVILGLIQVGGIGIMTLSALLALLVTRRIGLRMQLRTQNESHAPALSDARSVVRRVVLVSLGIELVVSVALAARFTAYTPDLGRALWLGVFHGISAFNNAGFGLYPDSLVRFVGDPWIQVPIVVAVVLGGIGFPVLFEIGRRLRVQRRRVRRRASLHVRLTVLTYGALLVVGITGITALEWGNAATLGPLSVPGKLLAGLTSGVMPRTAGFNVVDVGGFTPATLLVHDVLMIIGGGSAGTAGGIKVTTLAVLAGAVLAEARGEPTIHLLGRRVPTETVRQALVVSALAVTLVVTGTLTLLLVTGLSLDSVLFETVSAIGTVGLSTGITADLPAEGRLVLVALMFLGRLGPITLASALALRDRPRRYERAEERPVIG